MVFMQDLQDDYGISLKAQPDHINLGKEKIIRLNVDPALNTGKAESYTLEIDDDVINIVESDNAGVFMRCKCIKPNSSRQQRLCKFTTA